MATFHKQDFSFCHFIRLTACMERKRQAEMTRWGWDVVIRQSARLGTKVRNSFLDNSSNHKPQSSPWMNTLLFSRSVQFSRSVVSDSLQPHESQGSIRLARLLCLWGSPGKNTGVGCHFLLQGIFLTQGWNPCLLLWLVHCRQILYCWSAEEAQ